MSEENTQQDRLYKMLQVWLSDPPTIIWGSGATIQYGLPTMGELNEEIRKTNPSFNPNGLNFEEALGTCTETEIKKYREIIWRLISQRNNDAFSNIAKGLYENSGIPRLFHFCRTPTPELSNIVTTNYDCVLEYFLALNDIPFFRGVSSSPLSSFQDARYFSKKGVNLLKVHGSVDWFKKDDDVRVLYQTVEGYNPEIIIPGKQKYQEAFVPPYRDIIKKTDEIISNSRSFLAVGFGFNDQHITPGLIKRINQGYPIVVITKEITENTKKELLKAPKKITIEENPSDNKSSLINIHDKTTNESFSLPEKIWQLDHFMEVFECQK